MDLSKGVKRLTNRKRATPASAKLKEVKPEILSANLPTPVFGLNPNLQKEFEAPTTDDFFGVPVTTKEKDLISEKSLKIRRQLPVLEITDVSYTIMSHEELEKEAVFEVKNKDESGLYSIGDPRGGIVDQHITCVTCQKDYLECAGHLGMIRLNQPIIHPMMRKEVFYILSSVCGSCGGLLLPLETIREKKVLDLVGTARLKQLAKLSEKVPCRRNVVERESGIVPCIPNPIYKLENGKIIYTREEKTKGVYNTLTVDETETILDSITQEEALIMGFEGDSHPRRFIMKSLPVIPLCARAPVVQDGMILQDDLTNMYLDIVGCNIKLTKPDITEDERKQLVSDLTYKIEHMINNADGKYRAHKKNPYQSLQERIQGKEALIRKALMGKRVNYSGRAVIGPDPTLKFGQIRVPRVMASYLTQHEIVGPENIRKLTYLLRNGKVTYITPIAGRMAGRRLKVSEKIQKEHSLNIGDELDRWLENGDWVVYNRQPTLHKQGMMGYEVVLGDSLTTGLHLGYTKQHNADFDGDESALHAPQSEDARKEVAGLMAVTCNIMNAQTNTNIAGVVFDALTGSYILSLPETMVDKDTFMNIVLFMEDPSGLTTLNERLDKHNVPRYSGRALLSVLFPEDFYYEKDETNIRDGILISGTLSSSNIGSASGSIIQALYKDYGQRRTVDFLTDIYRSAGSYLDTHGFSVGMDDCFLQGKDPQNVINYEVQKAKMLAKSMGAKLLDPLEEERRENQVKAYLDTAKNLGAKISKENLGPDNSFNVMAKSGAKGSTFNIAQITGILGQQFIYGQRMPETISGRTRALPYFPENDMDPSSRGFIANSYLTGLTPSEYFFAQTASRIGLLDTATGVSAVGHGHRKLVKAMEDIKVAEDGSARNASGVVFQFSYGEDAFNAEMLESVKTKTGKFASFINIKRAVGRINQKYGY